MVSRSEAVKPRFRRKTQAEVDNTAICRLDASELYVSVTVHTVTDLVVKGIRHCDSMVAVGILCCESYRQRWNLSTCTTALREDRKRRWVRSSRPRFQSLHDLITFTNQNPKGDRVEAYIGGFGSKNRDEADRSTQVSLV